MSTKKILILNYEFPPLGGGAGNATYYMLKEFSKLDLEIDLVTSSINDFRIESFSPNIKIHYLDIGKRGNLHYQTNKDLLIYSYKAYCYSKKLLKKKKYSLIHAFFGIPSGFLAMQLRKKYKVPYIVSLRGSDVPFYNKRFYYLDKLIFKRLSRKIWRGAKSVIANSVGLRELAQKSIPRQEIKVIPNGVDTEEFKPRRRKKNKELTLISTGRLIERKGYQYLIPAIKGLKVKLILIGDGNLKKELKEKSKGINVEFLGEKKHIEIKKYLNEADIFILPSLNEGMSNSILEAMSTGLPIITTNTGGSEELIKGNGYVIEKANIKAIRDAIRKYEENPKLIEKHKEISRKLAITMSWENIASNYAEEYKQ